MDPLSASLAASDDAAPGDTFADDAEEDAVAPAPASASLHAAFAAGSVHSPDAAAVAQRGSSSGSADGAPRASLSPPKPRGFAPNVSVAATRRTAPPLAHALSLQDEPLDSPRPGSGGTTPAAAARRSGATADDSGAAPPLWHSAASAATSADAPPSYDEVLASGGASTPQLPPPSYADSVYFDRAEITPDAATSAATSAASASAPRPLPAPLSAPLGALAVAVTAPEKRADTGGSALGRLAGKRVVTFAVPFRADAAALHPYAHCAAAAPRRRFRDFVGLAARLAVSHRGYFVPPRPEKKLEGQLDASAEFIEERRDALDKWMRQLAAHPALRVAPALVTFLTAPGELDADAAWFAMAPEPGLVPASAAAAAASPAATASPSAAAAAASPPRRASGGSELVRALKELSTSVALAATPGGPPPGGIRENDTSFLEAKAKAASLEKQLLDASAKAERLVGRAASACDALGDAGLALVRLSKFEEAEGARRGRFSPHGAAQRLAAADARAAGAAAVRACRLGRAAAGQLAAQMAPLHAHLGLAPAVSRAVADRADALLTWQTLAAETEAKRAKAARTQAEPLKAGGPFGLGATTPASKSAALETLAKQLEAVSAAAAAAEAAYESIRGRNASEFARLDAQRSADFGAMAVGFARVQAAAGERGATIWAPLAEGLTLRGAGATPAAAAAADEEDDVAAAQAEAEAEAAAASGSGAGGAGADSD